MKDVPDSKRGFVNFAVLLPVVSTPYGPSPYSSSPLGIRTLKGHIFYDCHEIRRYLRGIKRCNRTFGSNSELATCPATCGRGVGPRQNDKQAAGVRRTRPSRRTLSGLQVPQRTARLSFRRS